jgi:thioredoxin reductase
MGQTDPGLVIIGAGPYGLSIAAHLRARQIPFRIFGEPMLSWRKHMPRGMSLKSEGFASSLYDPESSFTLARYCAEQGLPYADVGAPVPLETFVAYGLEFQRRLVPGLELAEVSKVRQTAHGFEVIISTGETLQAHTVIIAAGITHFDHVPEVLSALPAPLLTHSSAHHDLGEFGGKTVAVIGAGASAIDIAALLHDAGAEVQLIARRGAIDFHEPSVEPRPLVQRILAPRSGLGVGWRSRLCTDAPLLFHRMPERFRQRVVARHLGPAPGWFMKARIAGRVPLHLGVQIDNTHAETGRARVSLRGERGQYSLLVDRVIAATGYKVAIERLGFLDDRIRRQMRQAAEAPVLSRHFESSVPGLYLVGLASANSFGPLARFAFGAGFTARRLSRYLAARARR